MGHGVHLLVLIHGMWGNPGHMAELERVIKDKYSEPNKSGEELEVLVAKSNEGVSTYDGIELGAERIAKEVLGRVAELAKEEKVVVKFSVTGYSLGGLIARYMLGTLAAQKFFANVEPTNFITIATPHIGLLKYPSFVSSVLSVLGPKLLSKTGEQFYCQDQWGNSRRPLLEVMADPGEIFYQTLSCFNHLRLYANAVNDVTVPYCTAAIETEDLFAEYQCNGLDRKMEEQYEYVIKEFAVPETPPPKPAPLSQEWLNTMKPRPLLPPAAQFRFPFNLAVYSILPLLALPIISYVLYRFHSDSRASRDRIKKFESDESSKKTLVSMFDQLERQAENATVDVVDDPEGKLYPIIKANLHPTVTPSQKKMVTWLNQLPFEKKLAFFPRVRNSHAMIICRESHRFYQHKRGESVVKHWADHFVF